MRIDEIIDIAFREESGEDGPSRIDTIKEQLRGEVPPLTATSAPLSLVSFRCLLQDTSFPLEVYSVGDDLRERWIGWATDVPGEQSWVHGDRVTARSTQLPRDKYALSYFRPDYLGAVIKIYDDVSFKPASVHTFVGLLGSSPLPDGELELPAIHVLEMREAAREDAGDRDGLVAYLAGGLRGDMVAAEFLLLALLGSPAVRPPGLMPLGTLTVNIMGEVEVERIEAVYPVVVRLPLTMEVLHKAAFYPASDGSELSAGILQVAPGTVLVVQEDMGEGRLDEKATKNLRALMECITEQTLRYEYPYMDDLKMECDVRPIILSEGKSLLSADIHIPIQAGEPIEANDVNAYRGYLASRDHTKFRVPDEVGKVIQDEFVQGRKEDPLEQEQILKRRMRIARLLAISYDGTLTEEVWRRAVELDEAVRCRSL